MPGKPLVRDDSLMKYRVQQFIDARKPAQKGEEKKDRGAGSQNSLQSRKSNSKESWVAKKLKAGGK